MVTDWYVGPEQIQQAYLGQRLAWDRFLEGLLQDQVLWVPGLTDLTDRASNHALIPTAPIVVNNGIAFRNNRYIDLPDDLGYNQQVSVFAWFKRQGPLTNDHHILFGGPEFELTIHDSGYLRTGVVLNGLRQVANFGSGLTDGQWHHVGFTFDGTTMHRYANGGLIGTTSHPNSTLTSVVPSRRMGRFGSNATYYANCDVYDARVHKRVLTPSEVLQLVNRTTLSNIPDVVTYHGIRLI